MAAEEVEEEEESPRPSQAALLLRLHRRQAQVNPAQRNLPQHRRLRRPAVAQVPAAAQASLVVNLVAAPSQLAAAATLAHSRAAVAAQAPAPVRARAQAQVVEDTPEAVDQEAQAAPADQEDQEAQVATVVAAVVGDTVAAAVVEEAAVEASAALEEALEVIRFNRRGLCDGDDLVPCGYLRHIVGVSMSLGMH